MSNALMGLREKMTVKKQTREDGVEFKVFFGKQYIGNVITILDILKTWMRVLTYFDYEDQEPNNKMKAIIKGNSEIVDLIWFFAYRSEGIKKTQMINDIRGGNIESFELLINICRPIRKKQPELREIQLSNDLITQIDLSIPLDKTEKETYHIALRKYNDWKGKTEIIGHVVDKQLEKHANMNKMHELEIKIENLEKKIRELNFKVNLLLQNSPEN